MQDLRTAALVSFILVLPLTILELVHTTITRQNVPGFIALFGFLWLMPVGFVAVSLWIVRNLRAVNPIKLVFSVTVVLVLALIWGSLVLDQMPCFLGVPNCD